MESDSNLLYFFQKFILKSYIRWIKNNPCIHTWIMEKIYNVTDFAEMIGKSVKTLQRWDRDGVLVAYRSPSNRRYYTHAQYLEYLGQLNNSDGVNVAYARAFSKNQAEYLEDQLNLLRSYSTREGIPISVVYTDYGSGLNFRRKEWNKLI